MNLGISVEIGYPDRAVRGISHLDRGCPDTSVGLADDAAAAERFRAIESACGRIDHSI
jgi:hypothetical protein